MALNEASFQARLDHVLKTVFPSFREVGVEHQKSFSIKFGHHQVDVDLKEPSKHPSRAILDILLTIDGSNIMLLELKKEELQLDEEDVSQGISYARLIHPMPPLTLISNGKENWFYNTYTKQPIKRTEVDRDYITSITDNAFLLATKDFRQAVQLLLNREPELFSKIINQISQTKFARLSGTLGDFRKPLCGDFMIERHAIAKVEAHFGAGKPLVGLVGSAFSGKTNLLYQFFLKAKSENNFLLYLDGADHNYSIFQQLANHFTKEMKISISKDKIREWLLNSLTDTSESKFYLLLDNFNADLPEEIKGEIIELIDIFQGDSHHTLYTIDEFNFDKIAFVENRQYQTIIGQQSKIIRIEELNDQEYNNAREVLFEKYKITIEHGGHFAIEYREPRILRHLALLYQTELEEGKCVKIDAVPNLNLLGCISQNQTYTSKIRELYKKISACFFAEREIRSKDPELNIMASGSGAISMATFKHFFPEDVPELIKSSVVVFRKIREDMTVIYPKFQELIAIQSIGPMSRSVIEESKGEKSSAEICKFFVDLATPVPYCDIVATGVLKKISEKDVILFSRIVSELLKISPIRGKIAAGTKMITYAPDVGHIRIDFKDDMDDGGFLSDLLPFAILSQLAAFPLRSVEDDEHSSFDFHLYILDRVATCPEFLHRADVRSIKNLKGYQHHEFEGVGTLVSGTEGIIEAIVQSIQKCFFIIPGEIERLYERGFLDKNTQLLYRIYLALRSLIEVTDEDLAKRAKAYVDRFEPYFYGFLTDYLAENISDHGERAEWKSSLLGKKGK